MLKSVEFRDNLKIGSFRLVNTPEIVYIKQYVCVRLYRPITLIQYSGCKILYWDKQNNVTIIGVNYCLMRVGKERKKSKNTQWNLLT